MAQNGLGVIGVDAYAVTVVEMGSLTRSNGRCLAQCESRRVVAYRLELSTVAFGSGAECRADDVRAS